MERKKDMEEELGDKRQTGVLNKGNPDSGEQTTEQLAIRPEKRKRTKARICRQRRIYNTPFLSSNLQSPQPLNITTSNEDTLPMDSQLESHLPHHQHHRRRHLMLSLLPIHHISQHRHRHRKRRKKNCPNSANTSGSSTTSSGSGSSSSSSQSTFMQPTWIEQKITQLNCAKYVPSIKHPDRCGCGLFLEEHDIEVIRETEVNFMLPRSPTESERWQVKTHTRAVPTTAFGTVEFQGGPHPTKARYVRINYDTPPETVVELLLREWRLRVPSLVISVIGGLVNAPIQAKLASVVKRGLLRAAKTTGAWVITNGLDTGVTIHVGEALGDEVHVRGSKIVALGIAPWGVIQQRNMLSGINRTCHYHAQGTLAGRQDTALNPHHNYFLLADNGTSGTFSGAELCLRRRLEQYLAQQPIGLRRLGGHKSRVPVVGVLIEGGHHTFRRVFDLLTGQNPVPVVICDGSGRAADLLAFMFRYANPDGDLVPTLRRQVLSNIARIFQLNRSEAESLYLDMKLCMRRRDLLSVFQMGDATSDEIDLTILTALLQAPGQNLTLPDQLSLTMAWQRPDIARSRVLVNVNDWSISALENAMTDALINDQLDFVQLLLEKGLDIFKFLTDRRLEDLYFATNAIKSNFFNRLFRNLLDDRQNMTLQAIGNVLEQVIGNGYQHPYSSDQIDPHLRTVVVPNKQPGINRERWSYIGSSNHSPAVGSKNDAGLLSVWIPGERVPCVIYNGNEGDTSCFRYPYTELLQWALLTCRFSLARFMVLSGEEAIAKALLSVRILHGMRKFVDSESEAELIKSLKAQEDIFEKLAVELQEHCYRHDFYQTRRILTYELRNFSRNTCLSLAHMCESKSFIAHPCTQAILSDLWYGGLRESRFVSAKVTLILIGLVLPPFYPMIALLFSSSSWKFLEFKTREELSAQPQTWEEYLDEMRISSTRSSFSIGTSANLFPNSYSTDARTRVLGSFNLTTPLSPFRPMSEPVRRSKHSKGFPPLKESKSLPVIPLNDDGEEFTFSSSARKNEVNPNLIKQQTANAESPSVEIIQSFENYEPTVHHSRRHYLKTYEDLRYLASNRQIVDSPKHIFHNEPVLEYKIKTEQRSRRRSPLGTTHLEASEPDLASDKVRRGCTNSLPESVLRRAKSASGKLTMIAHQRSPVINSPYFQSLSYAGSITSGTAPFEYMGNTVDPDGVTDDQASFESHQHQLSCRKKIYEFFSAPVTRFYLHLLLYLVFLFMFICYSLITVPYQSLNGLETYIYLYIITYTLEKVREVNLAPGLNYWRKMGVFLTSFWNVYDFILGFISVIGVVVRLLGLRNQMVFLWGRNMLLCCCLFWIMRFLELMQIWHFSGPYIYLIVTMLRAMIPLLSLLFIPLLAFGTLREGIKVMNRTELTLEAFKNVLLEPYFMLYGEVYAPKIDPKDWGVNLTEIPLYEMVPIMNVVYLLYSLILLLNVIIAVFNGIYGRELAKSELNYKYLRYSIIIGYESRSLIPPPFVVISWIYAIVRNIYGCCRTKSRCRCCSRLTRRCRKYCQNILRKMEKVCCRRCFYPTSSSSFTSSSSSSSTSDHSSSDRHGNSFGIGHIFAPRTAMGDGHQHSNGLKLFLKREEVEKLHDFEEECVQTYCRETVNNENKQPTLQLENISSNMAAMQYHLSEIDLGQQELYALVRLMGDEALNCQGEVLSQMHEYKHQIANPIPKLSSDQISAILEKGDPGVLGPVLRLLENNTLDGSRRFTSDPNELGQGEMPPKQTLKLATFNIQVFGSSKSKKLDVMRILAEIICRFDGVFIQEIREKSGNAFQTLLDTVNKLCGQTSQTRYEGITGPRHGKSNIKEQIGFMYRSNSIILNKLIGIATDQFERPPDCFAITLQKAQIKIVVMAVHLDPDHVEREMEALYDLAPQCQELGGTENLIILGDMNADCGYLSKRRRESLRLKLDSNFKWLVPDEADTTVAASSCAYDRIIVSGRQLVSKGLSAEALNFEQMLGLTNTKAKEVSDHYPVEMLIK
nr:transient receptor potential cation channel [Hymenolepis microstoma]